MAHAETIEIENAAVEAIFSIGSNYGDRYENVCNGLKWLSGILDNFRSSAIYATPDCHGSSKEYLNAVATGATKLRPEELNLLCKEYEVANGRDDIMRKNGYVPVDIDLVVFDSQTMRPKDFKRDFFQIGFRMI